MPLQKTKPRKHTSHGPGKRGGDGLTDRERNYVRERRADLVSSEWVVMQRAGFVGTPGSLCRRAQQFMRKPLVAAAVRAPDKSIERDVDDEEGLKRELRRFYLSVVRSGASVSDKIKAADKLGAALAGFYVPVQVDLKGKVTMEGIVRAMGGAPEENQLPAHAEASCEN